MRETQEKLNLRMEESDSSFLKVHRLVFSGHTIEVICIEKRKEKKKGKRRKGKDKPNL